MSLEEQIFAFAIAMIISIVFLAFDFPVVVLISYVFALLFIQLTREGKR